MEQPASVPEVINTLKRVRVRQGENHIALALLAKQVEPLIGKNQHLSETAKDIKNYALQLRRAGRSVPRFVVEDLLQESISRLQQAHMLSSGLS